MKNFKVTSGYVTQYKGEETFDVDRFRSIQKMLLLVHLRGITNIIVKSHKRKQSKKRRN